MPGGNRSHDFQPTMNYKSDLPHELQSAATSQSAPSSQAAHFSPPAAGSLPNQSVPSPPPSLPRNDIESETESSDDDLPRMPDTSSEEEIENHEQRDNDPNQEDVESLPHSQPLFNSSAQANIEPNRRSLRYFFKHFYFGKTITNNLKG